MDLVMDMCDSTPFFVYRCVGSVIEKKITFGGYARGIMIFPLTLVSGSHVPIVYSFRRFERDSRLHQAVGLILLVGVPP